MGFGHGWAFCMVKVGQILDQNRRLRGTWKKKKKKKPLIILTNPPINFKSKPHHGMRSCDNKIGCKIKHPKSSIHGLILIQLFFLDIRSREWQVRCV
jgi:hypothetical protein